MNRLGHALFEPIRRAAADWWALREERRTAALIESLPTHLRKDIGWPEARARHRGRPR